MPNPIPSQPNAPIAPPPASPASPAVADPAAPASATPSTTQPPTAAPSPTQPAASPDDAVNLLATPPSQTPPPSNAQTPSPAPTPEQAAEITAKVEAITSTIKPIDLGTLPDGQPIPWDQAAVDRVAAVFAKRGVAPDVAQEVVAAYAEHAKAQYATAARAEAEQSAALNRAMVAETRAAFGPDLPRYLADANRGLLDIFGAEAGAQLAAVPMFANDHRIIAALAARGRAIGTDPVPAGPDARQEPLSTAAGLYRDALKHIK